MINNRINGRIDYSWFQHTKLMRIITKSTATTNNTGTHTHTHSGTVAFNLAFWNMRIVVIHVRWCDPIKRKSHVVVFLSLIFVGRYRNAHTVTGIGSHASFYYFVANEIVWPLPTVSSNQQNHTFFSALGNLSTLMHIHFSHSQFTVCRFISVLINYLRFAECKRWNRQIKIVGNYSGK